MPIAIIFSALSQSNDMAFMANSPLLFAVIAPFFSPANPIIQYYSVTLTLCMIVFFLYIALWNAGDSSEFLKDLFKLLFLVFWLLVIVGLFLLPASGKFADFLLWHAVTSTLVIASFIAVGMIDAFTNDQNLFWPYMIVIVLDVVIATMIWLA